MKQETKNEMDLLLRRLGRRDESTVSNAADEHLDADELSAYAENALPAAARARYTAHLAECSNCRKILVQLSSSAGVVSATESVKASGPSVWSRFLAGLFTPMVLRYAAPALGLIVVAVIGFVVLRRDQSPEYVTQVSNNEQRPTALPAAEPTASVVDSPSKAAAKQEDLAEQQKRNLQAETAPAPNAPPSVSSIETEVSKDAAAQPKPQQQPATANEAPPVKAAPEERPRSAEPEVSKKEVKEVPAATRAAPQTALQAEQRQDSRTHGFVRDKAADDVSAPAAGAGSKLKRDELNVSANSRTVAGRRFTKKGGVWIDSAYDSSKDSTTLARGSEQYRALVGDEPEIKTIADALDGEIIVVWKGRTYRIR
jgi:putative zinc finger protein